MQAPHASAMLCCGLAGTLIIWLILPKRLVFIGTYCQRPVLRSAIADALYDAIPSSAELTQAAEALELR